jgi:hypothetical protein
MRTKGVLAIADIINLNRARKAKARVDKAAQADANRARFGRTKAEKAADDAEAARLKRDLDGARRD